MSDRVYTEIRLSGKLPLAKKEELMTILEETGLYPIDGNPSAFYDEECNYAELDAVTDWLDAHGVNWFQYWDAGCGFPAGVQLRDFGGAYLRYGWSDHGVVLTAEMLEQELANNRTLSEVIDELKRLNRWRYDAPPLEFV